MGAKQTDSDSALMIAGMVTDAHGKVERYITSLNRLPADGLPADFAAAVLLVNNATEIILGRYGAAAARTLLDTGVDRLNTLTLQK
ncbi:MAG: hypothetical protein ABF504_10105 [Komagataeibacter saccharivorans]